MHFIIGKLFLSKVDFSEVLSLNLEGSKVMCFQKLDDSKVAHLVISTKKWKIHIKSSNIITAKVRARK